MQFFYLCQQQSSKKWGLFWLIFFFTLNLDSDAEIWSFLVLSTSCTTIFVTFLPNFQVAFKLSDALANKEDENINKKEEKDNNKKEDRDTTSSDVKDKVKVPREYKMVLSRVEQSMGMFSERTAGCIAYLKVFLYFIPPNSNTFSDLGWTCLTSFMPNYMHYFISLLHFVVAEGKGCESNTWKKS